MCLEGGLGQLSPDGSPWDSTVRAGRCRRSSVRCGELARPLNVGAGSARPRGEPRAPWRRAGSHGRRGDRPRARARGERYGAGGGGAERASRQEGERAAGRAVAGKAGSEGQPAARPGTKPLRLLWCGGCRAPCAEWEEPQRWRLLVPCVRGCPGLRRLLE